MTIAPHLAINGRYCRNSDKCSPDHPDRQANTLTRFRARPGQMVQSSGGLTRRAHNSCTGNSAESLNCPSASAPSWIEPPVLSGAPSEKAETTRPPGTGITAYQSRINTGWGHAVGQHHPELAGSSPLSPKDMKQLAYRFSARTVYSREK